MLRCKQSVNVIKPSHLFAIRPPLPRTSPHSPLCPLSWLLSGPLYHSFKIVVALKPLANVSMSLFRAGQGPASPPAPSWVLADWRPSAGWVTGGVGEGPDGRCDSCCCCCCWWLSLSRALVGGMVQGTTGALGERPGPVCCVEPSQSCCCSPVGSLLQMSLLGRCSLVLELSMWRAAGTGFNLQPSGSSHLWDWGRLLLFKV